MLVWMVGFMVVGEENSGNVLIVGDVCVGSRFGISFFIYLNDIFLSKKIRFV